MARSNKTNGSRSSTEGSATRTTKKRQEAPYSATPTLNERLRKNGKWVFLLLAVVFAITFVFAGVGTSGPSLIDLLGQDSDSSPTETVQKSNTAVQKAEAAAKATPEDPQAWITLAKAAELAPEDAAEQSTVADIYLAQAAAALQKAQALYATAQGGGLVDGRTAVPQQVIPGQSRGATPFQTAQESISSAKLADVSAEVSPLQTQANDAYVAAVAAQTTVTELEPKDPAAWFRLGQIATAANDTTGAITAYEKFVKLAPADPLTKKVEEEIKRLKESQLPLQTG